MCTQSATSPELLSLAKYLVAIFWIGLIIAAWYVIEELLKVWRARQATKQAREKSIAAKLAGEDAAASPGGEDAPDSPEAASPTPARQRRGGRHRSAGSEDLEDADDDADSKADEEK